MRCLLVLILLICVGCSPDSRETLPPDTAPEDSILRTDKRVYEARYVGGEGVYKMYAFTLEASFTNSFEQTVYLEKCFPDSQTPIHNVVLTGPGDSAYVLPWGCVAHDKHLAIAPGDSYDFSLTVRGPNIRDGVTKEPHGLLEGRFHLIINSFCRDTAESCLADNLTSNTFDIRLED